MLKSILMAGTAATLIMGGTAAQAQSSDDTAVGLTAGAGAGAVAGAIAGGPVGAVIGGFAGAALGTAATVPEPVVTYSTANPVTPVTIASKVEIGAKVDNSVTLHKVPDNPDYAYFYANGRAYIVDAGTREVVYSPGYVVPQKTITYVEANPTASLQWDGGTVQPGVQLPDDANLVAVPESQVYSYAYVNDAPVLVDNRTHTIVWAG